MQRTLLCSWTQLSFLEQHMATGHPYIGQGKQRLHLYGILRKPAITHFAIPKLPFDHTERMCNSCPYPDNAFLQAIRPATFAPMGDRAHCREFGYNRTLCRYIVHFLPFYRHRPSLLDHAGACLPGSHWRHWLLCGGRGALHRCLR